MLDDGKTQSFGPFAGKRPDPGKQPGQDFVRHADFTFALLCFRKLVPPLVPRALNLNAVARNVAIPEGEGLRFADASEYD